MRMTYTYARMQALFTIAEYPECWGHVVNLLIKIKETDQLGSPCMMSQPVAESTVVELVHGREY